MINRENSTRVKIQLTVFMTFVLITSALILSCGRLPPEKFWTGDNADSSNVKQEIEKYNKDEWQGYLSRFDFIGTVDTIKFQSTTIFPGDETRSLEFRIKQAYFPNRLTITLDNPETDTNFTFVYDTTVTVDLVTKIKGTVMIGCDSVHKYLRDTIIGFDTLMYFDAGWTDKAVLRETIIRGDTVLADTGLVKDPNATRFSGIITKQFDGQVWRSLYFEPEQKNASPRNWKLKKTSGGSTIRIPDSEDDAPYNYYTMLREKSPGIAAETVYDRPDTLHYGIHRLYYFPDSIWTYGAGRDSLEIGALTKVLNPQDSTFYFVYCDHYYSIEALGSKSRVKITPGVYPESTNFYSVMLCPRQGLIYKNSPFKFRVWQLPVKVQ